jgi:hypothetical protein
MPTALAARVLVASVLAFAAVAGTLRLRAYDTFWHLAAGRWILEHGAVPRVDPFRFTSHGTPWVDHEWLFQVAIAALERAGGLQALVVARTLLVVGIEAVLLRELRRSGAPLAGAVVVVVAAVLGARGRLFLRPELASLLGVVLLLALLQRLRREGGWRPVVLAVGLVAVWVNFHPGALLAPPLAAAYLLGARLPGGWGPPVRGARPVPWAQVALLPALTALALLANPYGARVVSVPFGIAAGLRGLPAVNPEWLPAWRAPQPYLLAGVAALIALATVTVLRRRRAEAGESSNGLEKRPSGREGGLDPATGLVALLLACLAATAVRHQGLFFLGAAFFAGECLAALARATGRTEASEKRAPSERRAAVLAVTLCALAAVWCLWPPSSGPLRPRQGRFVPGFGIEPGRFPEKAVDDLARRRGVGNLYNDVAFGGYLLWRFYPPRQVFIDSRNEVRPDLLHELARARADEREWRALLDRYAVDAALVRYDDRLRPLVTLDPQGRPSRVEHHTASALLFPRDRFALIYWDDLALLFLRRTQARAAALAREEYRFVQPEDWRATLAAAAADPAFRAAALAEVDRRLREDPALRRAAGLREALLALDAGPSRQLRRPDRRSYDSPASRH